MGTGNDPGVLPGRTNRVFGTEGANAESGATVPARDARYGDQAAKQGASLAATLSNHEAVAGEADARRAARGNASLRFALITGFASGRIPTNTSISTKGTFLMS